MSRPTHVITSTDNRGRTETIEAHDVSVVDADLYGARVAFTTSYGTRLCVELTPRGRPRTLVTPVDCDPGLAR